VHKVFQLQNKLGMTDQFIHPQEYPDGVAQPTEEKNLSVITSGSLPPNPSELLGSQRMVEIFQTLKAQFDMVVLDSPPTLAVTDANVLATRVDGVILVINPRVSKRAAIKHAIEQLVQVKANIIGVVLNGVDVKKSRYGYYRGYYHKSGHGYDDYTDAESSWIKKLKFRKTSHQEAPLEPGSKNPSDQQKNT
jgi:capsular exopolysaccharide synthesis family protein